MNRQTIATLLLIFPFPAFAHTGFGLVPSFSAGFVHPWLGVDHLLAMTALGVWAASSGGRRLWMLPAAFLVAMTVGALLNFVGFDLPGAEFGVALSVLALGLLLACNRPMPAFMAVILVVIFAAGHGYVHMAEIGSQNDALVYGLGFLISTAALQYAGLAAGMTGPTLLKAVRTALSVICTLTGTVLLAGV